MWYIIVIATVMAKNEIDFLPYEAHKRNVKIDAPAFAASLILLAVSSVGTVDMFEEKANPYAFLLALGLSLLFTFTTGKSLLSEFRGMRRKRHLKQP